MTAGAFRVAETPYVKFRLPPDILDALDALATGNGMIRTLALKEAVAQWATAVWLAGEQNAAELTREDWHRLALVQNLWPNHGPAQDKRQFAYPFSCDYSLWLANELMRMWAGRELVLPTQREEQRQCSLLAQRVLNMGPIRGYALMCALRLYNSVPACDIESCISPEAWMRRASRVQTPVDYELTKTGANGYRVRVTRHSNGAYLAEALIVPDKGGWRVAVEHPSDGGFTFEPASPHTTPDAAASWFASWVRVS